MAGAGETGPYSFTFSATTSAAGAVIAYTGVDPNNPIDASAVATDSSKTSHVAPAVTTTTANDKLLVTLGATGTSTITKNAAMTERWNQKTTATLTNVENEGADQAIAAIGSTGTRTVTTASSANAIMHTIAIRPLRGTAGNISGRTPAKATTGSAVASSLSIAMPSGTLQGDLLLAQVTWTATAGVPAISAPSGWTSLGGTQASSTTSDAVFYKVAAPAETGPYSFTFTAPTSAAGAVISYTGVDPANPIDRYQTSTDSNQTSHSAPILTTTSPNDMLLVTFGAASTATMTNASMTERWNQKTTAATANVENEGADAVIETQGSTGTRTITTSTGANGVMHSIAVRPASTSQIRYGYAGHEDTPSLELDGLNNVLNRTVPLIGGVVVTRKASTPSSNDAWSYPNLHNDIAATANGSGQKTGATFTYDPYGQPLAGFASNTASQLSYGWEGAKQKLTEHQSDIATIEMGARPYVPGIGRFLSVDPKEGGCANDYVYAYGDSVNHPDLDGRGIHFKKIFHKALCAGYNAVEYVASAWSGVQRDSSQSTSSPGDVLTATGVALYNAAVEASTIAVTPAAAAVATGVIVVGAVAIAVGVAASIDAAIKDCS